jgi:DNA-3-methyladenine glycosylase II
MLPDYWPLARQHLSDTDPVLAGIVRRHPDAMLESRGDAFITLARSIVGQQISVKASESVWKRLCAALSALTPEHVAEAPPAELQGCGLSGRKVEYIQDLARHFVSGSLLPERWPALEDEVLIAELIKVRGIGRWTAEMFLIFNLMRPDVLPLDDIGLQRAMNNLYNGGNPLGRAGMRRIAEAWRPWRSVATWYLWRSLDPEPVAY